MARRLPDDPEKRRLQVFKRCYQNLEHWHALKEDRGMDDVITTPEVEDIYLPDLLVGLDELPRRQREAFELICLQGYTETAARDVMLPNSVSSTPIQQYADSGLVRMVRAYDIKQGKRFLMAVLHPLVKAGLENTRKKILAEMDLLQQGLAQVEAMLGGGVPEVVPKAAPPAPAPTPREPVSPLQQQRSGPPPTPKPEGKPSLADAAKELAAAATS